MLADPATADQVRPGSECILRVEHATVEFPLPTGGTLKAVSDVSFDVKRGETLGVVGESGCGKSSMARAVMQLPPPSQGKVFLDDIELTSIRGEELRRLRPRMQMIFQDPISSLNPRRTVADIVGEPAVVWRHPSRSELRELVDDTLSAVGLDPRTTRDRRPVEFSGGQCQRISIARALILDPEVIICDEPVSALDVSIQAQILNLLEDLRERRNLTLVFISHDLAVVKNVSDRIAVMYLGRVCEIGSAESVYRSRAHPYTAALLTAIPSLDVRPRGRRLSLVGELPSAADPPSGCRFRTRCPHATDRCAAEEPPLRQVAPDHFVACHYPLVGSPEATP